MEAREYTAEDYPTLCEWWEGHNDMAFMPQEFLPKTGLIVDGIASMFLYTGNYRMSLIQWPVSNIKQSAIRMLKAFDAIIKKFQDTSARGEMLVAYPNGTGLQKLYKRNDFTMVNEFNKEMIWGPK